MLYYNGFDIVELGSGEQSEGDYISDVLNMNPIEYWKEQENCQGKRLQKKGA